MCKQISRLFIVVMMIVSLAVPALAVGSNPWNPRQLQYPSRETLIEMDWGTNLRYDLPSSFKHSFRQYHQDLATNDPMAYLHLSTTVRKDVLKNPHNYKVSPSTCKLEGENTHRYTHKENGNFIILSESTYKIYAFGTNSTDDSVTEKDVIDAGWDDVEGRPIMESFNYHFQKHKDDKNVEVKTKQSFLKMAIETREDVVKNPGNYRTVELEARSGGKPCCKYVHKDTKLFIILTSPGHTIYAFGGKYKRVVRNATRPT